MYLAARMASLPSQIFILGGTSSGACASGFGVCCSLSGLNQFHASYILDERWQSFSDAQFVHGNGKVETETNHLVYLSTYPFPKIKILI